MNFKSPIDLTNGSTMGGNALAVQVNHYTKMELQTSGSAQVHYGNLTNVPTSFTPAVHDHDDRYYTESESDARFLGILAKAADADKLDGIDSLGFTRAGARTDNYIWARRNAGDSVAFFTQQGTGDILRFYKGTGDGTQLTAIDNNGNFTGNASTASKWLASRTITLTGGVSGTISLDGSSDVSAAITVPDATTGAKGVVQLYGGVDSTSAAYAATSSAVKTAYDLAAGKVGKTGGNSISGNNEFYSTDTTGVYSNSAIELREVNLVGSAQSASAYAPAIALHWGGRVQAQIALESSGVVTLRDGSSFAVDKTLNAGGLQVAGNAVWHAGNFTPSSYIPLSGSTAVTGDIHFTDSGTALRGIQGTMGTNDLWRVKGGATAANAGYLEIATADDANEPIYVRQYSGLFTTVARTLTLLDASGNTTLPGDLTVSGGEISGPSGIIIKASDSWLRINEDRYHTSGIYFGSSVTRTDGELQVGSSGVDFKASSTGVTIKNKVRLEYNSTENSLDFVFI